MKKLLVAALANALLVATIAIPEEVNAQTAQSNHTEISSRNYISPIGCDIGKLVNDGIICVAEFLEDQRPFSRVARLGISLSGLSFETLDLIEFESNDANIAFLFIMDRHITSSPYERPTRFPVVKAYIRNDGTVSIDSDYGEFPPGSSSEEVSARMLEMHEEEIRMLISALTGTR